MRVELGIAAACCFALAGGHTAVGVRWVLPKLEEARLPRTRVGAPVPMLRFTWHVVTVLMLALGVLLAALAVAPEANTRTLVLRWASASFLAATALAFWMNRRRVRTFIRLPVPLLFVVIAVMCWAAGCGGDASGALGDRANFRKFPVYYVGDSFHGHSLNSQQSPDSEEQAGRAVDFLYGDCKPEGDAGCPAPLEIETFAECARPQYPRSLPSRARRLRIRGVPAALFGPGDWIELYTGNVTVVIHADGGVTLMRQAAQALRSADGRIGPDDPLPAPSRKAGRSPC